MPYHYNNNNSPIYIYLFLVSNTNQKIIYSIASHLPPAEFCKLIYRGMGGGEGVQKHGNHDAVSLKIKFQNFHYTKLLNILYSQHVCPLLATKSYYIQKWNKNVLAEKIEYTKKYFPLFIVFLSLVFPQISLSLSSYIHIEILLLRRIFTILSNILKTRWYSTARGILLLIKHKYI